MASCSPNNFSSFPIRLNKSSQDVIAPSKSLTFSQIPSHGLNLLAGPSQDYLVRHQAKLKEASLVIRRNAENQQDCMILIDILQQFAIDHHFQEEIQDVLSRQFQRIMASGGVINHKTLYNVSLCFRVLRQNGYPVPTGVFNMFVNKDGKFGHQLSNDLEGMMSLYQASQLGMEGEDILDEANAFTRKHLAHSMLHLSQDQSRVVSDILLHPYHLNLTRFNVKNCIQNHNYLHTTFGSQLRELAAINFNIVQSLHNRELEQVARWWKELGLMQKLGFARDQPVKWYMGSMATLEDPLFTEERIHLTKCIALIYIMDDIFDVHGTLEELVLFTEAINRWDVNAVEQLPLPMKMFIKALVDITDELSHTIFMKHGWNPFNSLRKSWTRLCNAFLVEAKWFASGHLPASEEYLENGVISTGAEVMFVHIFFLLGQGINKETVDLVENMPGLIHYPATILRLWDDLGTAKDENQQGYDGSYINCYMNENSGMTLDRARKHVFDVIWSTWKKLNKESLSPSPFSVSFRTASLNAARMVHLMYNYDGDHQLPILEKHIKSVLYETIPTPIPLQDN